MSKTVVVALVILSSHLMACSAGQMHASEFLGYLNNPEHGLTVRQEVGDMVFTAQYRPLVYEVWAQAGNAMMTKSELDKQLAENNGQQYYLFSIGSKTKGVDALTTGISEQYQYEERVRYLLGQIQQQFLLVSGSDTFPCKMHHYERTYRLGETHKMMLVFEPKDTEAEQQLIYKDELFGVGRLLFNIHKNDIKDIPELIL